MSQISKPYPHGSRFRCRIRTSEGWKWCPAADSPEAAVALAQGAEEPDSDFHLQEDPETSNSSLQPKESVRATKLEGPYSHRGKIRYRVVSSDGRRWAPAGRTEKEALRFAEHYAETTARKGNITIRDAIEAHVEGKRQAGARPATLEGTRNGLLRYFCGILDSPVGRLTPRRAQEQYDLLRQAVNPKTKRTLSVATHRSFLCQARTFGRWIVSKGWIRSASPLEGVKGVGRKKRGKPQLGMDEARRLYAVCMREGAAGDAGAVATLACICMATRSSEVLSRVVRDLDDGGRILRVEDNDQVAFRAKSESSRRPISIPTDLQPLFAKLARDKQSAAPLFPGSLAGRKSRQWLWSEVRRLCDLADVPVVCPHSLRGLMATLAASAGALPELVARTLGHTDATMTLNHYIQEGVSQTAQRERGLEVLTQRHQPSSPPC